ncbi:MAG: hypothetical protein QM831_41655 [Kofleriaceae bacterium]
MAKKQLDRGHELLAACFGGDPAAQLVYADWLEEQGHPAAKAIRAKTDTAAEKAIDPKLFGKAVDWVTPFQNKRFDRGMLREVHSASGAYVSKATQAALLPIVSRFGVRTTALTGTSAKLGDAETLAWTGAFRWFQSEIDDARASALAKSPHLAHGRLRSLALHRLKLGNAGLKALAKSPAIANVTSLELLSPVNLGAFEVQAVVGLVGAMPLERLSLSGPFRTKIENLGRAPAIAKLSFLSLTGVSARVLRTLLDGDQLTGLRSMYLGAYEPIPDAVLEPLFGLSALAKVEIWSEERNVSPAMRRRLRQRFGK